MTRGTRDRMVRSAAVALRTHGVRGTSFGRVLADSGAPRGSIGHHFPGGKAEMILAAVIGASDEISDQLRALRTGGASAAQLVAAMCDYFADGLVRSGFRAGCPVAAVANEAFDDQVLREAAGSAMGDWVAIVAEVLRAEGHPADEADDLARLCLAAVEGAITMARVQQSVDPLLAVRRRLVGLLAEGGRT